MRTKLLLMVVSLFISISAVSAQQIDEVDTLAKYFRNSDSPNLSTLFSSTLELNILSEENLYSKAQAEQIIRDFFSKNKPVSVQIVHRLGSNPNYKLAVFSLATGKDNFRISISLSNDGERFLIKQIRIEYTKQ